MAGSLATEPGAAGTAGGIQTAETARAAAVSTLARTALMLLPGALIVYMGFNAGGYFPISPAVGALVLGQVLLLRIMLAERPFEGFSAIGLVAIVALALYALMSLVSSAWSHAPGTALTEFDRAWMYLLMLILMGSVRAGPEDLRWLIRGLVAGMAVVCLAGLMSRVLPNVLHTSGTVSAERLSYPVTYWNALGLLASLAIILAVHLTATLTEARLVRVLAAPLVPLLAVTLYLTVSRGPILALAIGLIVYVLYARPRGLLSGAIALVPTTAIAVVVAYHATLLNTADPTVPAAVLQGHHVAWVAGACALGALALRLILVFALDPGLRRVHERIHVGPLARRLLAGGAAAVLAAVVVALFASHVVSRGWHHFISGGGVYSGTELHSRLTNLSDDGRTELWKVALHGFSSSPAHGHGAGMYTDLWARHRGVLSFVEDAHSLYLQTMAELGIPGIAFIAIMVLAVLVGLALRGRRGQRSACGALLAAGVAWAVHAGIDWDWQMPVVTLAFFAGAGAALSPPPGRRSWVPSGNIRMLLALACLACAVAPVLIIGSQSRINDARDALHSGDCLKASNDALSSIGWLDVNPQPYEVLGFCDLNHGLPRRAVSAMRQGVKQNPHSWETHYTLAIALAADGLDPRAQARRAHRMNPLEDLTGEAVKQFATSRAIQWVERAPKVYAAALASRDLSISPT